MIKFFKKLKALKNNPLVGYSYNSGGGMTGGHEYIGIMKISGDKALVTFSESEWYNQDSDISEYLVPVSVIDEIAEIFRKYKMWRYPKLPKNRIFVCDAPTQSYRFSIEGMTSDVSFGSYLSITKRGYDGLRKISDLIHEAVKNSEKLPALIIERSEDNSINYTITRGKLSLSVYEYSRYHINYRVTNGLSETVMLTADETLYRLDSDNRTEIYRKSGNSSFELNPDYTREIRFKPSNDHLPAGKYLLYVSGIETIFELN